MIRERPNRAEGSTREVEYRNLRRIRDNDLENIPERVSSMRENPSGNLRNVSHSHWRTEVYLKKSQPQRQQIRLSRGERNPRPV